MLTAVQIAARENKLTASRVACLMTGDEERIIDLWREMIGDPYYTPDDLSGIWPVQLGLVTEQLNLDWFERKYGAVTRRGQVVTGDPDWAACTLDGWSIARNCPVECKHVGGHERPSEIISRYQPQMQWTMIVTSAEQCAFSVISAANEPTVDFIPRDRIYGDILMSRAVTFMKCVEDMVPPLSIAPATPPVIPSREYDVTGNNMWAAAAADWLANIRGKKTAEKAEKELKSIVPSDALKCFGHGVNISRARNGNLTIKAVET